MTTRKQLAAALARVDWLQLSQRLAVFCRELRGDDAEVIAAETQREIERSQRLRSTIEGFASTVTKGRDA